MLRLVIQRPIAISMLFLALVLIGALSFKRLPVALLPSITYPRLTTITTYEDIPAEDLERLVTQPIEEVVTALSGVRRVVSRTREGISVITVEYEWGTEMDFANLHLREAVDRVAFREDFPEDADRPVILRWDPLSRPISILTLSGDHRLESITEFAREVVKPAIEQVDGISQAEIVGGAEREIRVEPDTGKMDIYGITIEDIQNALARSNISFPGGKVRKGPLHLSLRIAGEYETLEDIESTDIVRVGRSSIRVGDIARVMDTVKDPKGLTFLGDAQVVSVLIYKEPEANTIQVSAEVKRALGVLGADYGGFNYGFVYEDADYVKASFDGLVRSLIIGAFLAFFILFFFLRDFRSPIVVGVAIPVSITITFALLFFGKVNLNLMSLGGLSLATGMLVDNAIVVLENINRHLTESSGVPVGETKVERTRRIADACVVGTREMARPVLAATLTTVAVFFPVVYVPGIAGAFFRDQALTVTFSLLVSVAAALLLQPILSARLLRRREGPSRGLFRVFEAAYDRFYKSYHGALIKALRKPALMLVLLLVGIAATALVGLRIDRTLMPQRSSGNLRLDLELPSGTPLEETASTVAELAGWLQDNPDVDKVFSQVGETDQTLASIKDYTGPNTARLRVILVPGRGGREKGLRVQEETVRRLAQNPGIQYVFHEEGIGLRELLASDEAPFSIGVVAEDPLEAFRVAEELAQGLTELNPDREIKIDRVLGTPNVVVRLDAEEIIRAGLDPELVARDLRNRISGVEATTFNEVDQRIDISVRVARTERLNLANALNAPIQLASGETVPLGTFVDLSEERPFRELTRKNQRRMVTVSADVLGGTVNDAWKEAMEVLSTMDLPPGVRIETGGERREMVQSFKDLAWAMLLAVLLVYMILAAQFESFVDPLLIASVIPMGLAGSVLAIAVSGGSINMLSMIGMVALLGIAVNDAIVKIDTIRRLRSEGMDGYEAILEASR
ncbi:MAG: efflux RND transporter permease subunit, partial [bacterium]|nr:efflux RND transporter permease subunit [bacterium]